MVEDYSRSIQAPIFILGIMPRSGTNFLFDLLVLHSHCQPGLANEDFVTAHSDLLLNYAESVSQEWKSNWKIKQQLDHPEQLLLQYLGEGLISFLNKRAELEPNHENQATLTELHRKRLITKTPTVKNLSYFFALFPQAYLIILLRDGRAVIDSGIRSFRWNFEVMSHAWAEAAKTIVDFEQHNSGQRYLIVRYENLYQETEKELKRIFSFVGLDPDCYDLQQAANLPIRGSSDLSKTGKIHWAQMEKSAEFNPLTRWHDWNQAKLKRFNSIAGKYLVHFGYCSPGELRVSFLWHTWNFVLDLKWVIRTLLAIPFNFLVPRK